MELNTLAGGKPIKIRLPQPPVAQRLTSHKTVVLSLWRLGINLIVVNPEAEE